MTEFLDRLDAGRQLAQRLRGLCNRDIVVVGLPRGGVPVAGVVARELDAPLDVVMVRKLGVPRYPEVAMGAIGEQGVRVLDEAIVDRAGVTPGQVAEVEQQEQAVLQERAARFREGRERLDLSGRTVLIVDDGIATGATARVACLSARQQGAVTVLVAAPVATRQAVERLTDADEVVVLSTPPDFRAVGQYYRDFSPTTDDEVVAALDRAARRRRERAGGDTAAPAAPMEQAPVSDEVRIPAGQVVLEGHFHLPSAGAPVVVFAHGSGSSRHSRRNHYVASVLQEAGLGTLLLDLLTREEAADRANVFDIGLLAGRLTAAEDWVRGQSQSMSSPIGFFGASTGAGAALRAAAEPGTSAGAVVSRGGRPDLAGQQLADVQAPTLLIVGGQDREVLALNRQARDQLRCESRLEIVEGATHLFEEPGTLEQAAGLAREWFLRHLSPPDGTATDMEAAS
ncbi:phosphoribosyltransferase family protein [Corynebacterium halotolerans]|uniref:Phosphoribosyltransferase n=1 Tax=Corynebacterium halotolerans YIM 70093 = DSM 44683 TaxID=1121362 RepID=M1P177_9CORY|nr:phosphoribosyltransferase family protein [Corynebacterium halotolerans]AGF73535.1 phosphoribosyltransferase [Corynebacterium halotolerans YIM 70093 = DSM 44683]